MRIVLDTNVIISAVIRDGKPRRLFRLGLDGKYEILLSKKMMEEISSVLQRSKFKMTKDEVHHVVSMLAVTSEVVTVTSSFKAIKNDPDDDIIINTAYDGNANYIVTGDDDIRELQDFKGILVVSVDQMLKIFENS